MREALGIDIGGTGIKGGRVNLDTGELTSDRIKYATPEGGHPGDVLEVVQTILGELAAKPEEHLGICFPAVVTHGMTRSAANVSRDWIDFPAEESFSHALGHVTHFINDADAAGFAEMRLGAAQNVSGMAILTTLGTGIGSAILVDGELIPHSELGHLELDGTDAEHRMSNAAREREALSFEQWGARLSHFYTHLEKIFSPELFIVGGGISAQHEDFFRFITIRTPLVPAAFLNNAGIVGGALLASEQPR